MKWLCVCVCFCFIPVFYVYNFRWSVSVNTEQKVPWIPTCQENTSPDQCKTDPNSVQCSYDEELHKWPVFSKKLPPWSCKTTGMSGRSTFTNLLRTLWHIQLWGLYRGLHLSQLAATVFQTLLPSLMAILLLPFRFQLCASMWFLVFFVVFFFLVPKSL